MAVVNPITGLGTGQGYQYDPRVGGNIYRYNSSPISGGKGQAQESQIQNYDIQEQQRRQAATDTGQVYTPTPFGGMSTGGRSGSGGSGGAVNIGGGTYPTGGGPFVAPGGASVVTSPGAGGGNINLSRDAYEAQQMALLRSKLAKDFLGGIGVGGVNPGAQVQYGGTDFDAARNAAFARAKEQAGQTAQSGVKGLQGLMAQRGLRDSTIEAGALGDILRGGTADVNEFTREQLLQDLARQQHVADTTYQGGIVQRGQNIDAQRALLQLFGSVY